MLGLDNAGKTTILCERTYNFVLRSGCACACGWDGEPSSTAVDHAPVENFALQSPTQRRAPGFCPSQLLQEYVLPCASHTLQCLASLARLPHVLCALPCFADRLHVGEVVQTIPSEWLNAVWSAFNWPYAFGVVYNLSRGPSAASCRHWQPVCPLFLKQLRMGVEG